MLNLFSLNHTFIQADKYIFCLCPVQAKNGRSMQVMTQFARKIAAGEVAGLGRQLIPRKPESLDDLTNLCHLFNSLELFLWLQNKFPPANVMEQHTAMSRRDACVVLIGKGLARVCCNFVMQYIDVVLFVSCLSLSTNGFPFVSFFLQKPRPRI